MLIEFRVAMRSQSRISDFALSLPSHTFYFTNTMVLFAERMALISNYLKFTVNYLTKSD